MEAIRYIHNNPGTLNKGVIAKRHRIDSNFTKYLSDNGYISADKYTRIFRWSGDALSDERQLRDLAIKCMVCAQKKRQGYRKKAMAAKDAKTVQPQILISVPPKPVEPHKPEPVRHEKKKRTKRHVNILWGLISFSW